MFEERRQTPRYPVLIRTAVSVLNERFDAVCTSVSPVGAFFTTRNPPHVGARVVVEIRSGGVDSPIVNLYAQVVRTVLAGSPYPIGFAVTWQTARCDVGWEPMFRVLRQILRVDHVNESELTADRSAEFAFRTVQNAETTPDLVHSPPDSRDLVPDHRASSVRQVRGLWSAPVHRPVVTPREPSPGDSGRQPVQNPVELDAAVRTTGEFRVAPAVQPPVRAPGPTPLTQPSPPRAEQARVSAALSPSHVTVHRSGAVQAEAVVDRSQLFEGFSDAPSVSVGRGHDAVSPIPPDASQSWPVYALAPGERRVVSQPEHVAALRSEAVPRPLPLPRQSADAVYARDDGTPGRDVPPPRAADAVFGVAVRAPASQPEGTTLAPVGVPVSEPFAGARPLASPLPPASPSPAVTPRHAPSEPQVPPMRRQPDSARMLYVPNVPVTFLRHNRFVPAELVGLAEQLAALVTTDDAPDLDEPLTIHLPVRLDDQWRTVLLLGKLLQVATETAEGKRFVMHIERVEEGRFKGAFRAFLHGLIRP